MKNNTIFLLSFALALACFASDWPQFKRTANRQGCSLSEQIALPSKLCCWMDFGSPIKASATVVNGKAYVVSGRGLLARIDLATNSIDWRANLGGVNNESTPSVGNGKIYVGSTAGDFYVLDAATGEILKIYPANAAILASPLLFKNSVYFGSTDGMFHALDLDGNPKWTFQADSGIFYGAAADSDWIIFPSGLYTVYWLRDMQTRAESAYVHRSIKTLGSLTPCSEPVIWGGHVYLGFAGQENPGRFVGFDLDGSGVDTTLADRTVRTAFSVDTATGILFFGSSYWGLSSRGGFTNWGTMNPDWATPPSGAYGVNSSPAVIQNCVIFGEETGKIHFCKKDTVGRYPYADWNSMNLGGAYAIWSYSLPSGKAIEASPAVSDGKVVVGSMDGCLYGFWDGTEVTAPVIVDSLSTGSKNSAAVPGRWTLTAFPNPASAGMINLEIAGLKGKATIAIYNISGSLIKTLETQVKGAVQWDIRNGQGKAVPSGTYYAVVRNAGGKQVRTFTLQVVK